MKATKTANKIYNTDEKYELIKWYGELRKTTNNAFFDLYTVTDRYLVLMGGGGSGKSIFAGRKILERVTSEAGHRVLVCRKVGKTLKQSCFTQLVKQIQRHYNYKDFKINQSDYVIRYKNGSEILFTGLDDVEKLKSIADITMIWIEEASEIDEQDFNQLDIRLRGETRQYKQIIISFNPISVNHWLKKRFFDIKSDGVRTHQSTYKDNRFLDDEAIRVLESFKDTDPYYYDVYCLGQWGVYGATVFDAQRVNFRLSQLVKPIKAGRYTFDENNALNISNIAWESDEGGEVIIYKEPVKGVPYVLGGDTAGEGSDYFTASVLDNRTGEQVATLRHKYDEDIYAQQVYCLGMYYNIALIGLEVNFSTYPTKMLEKYKYKNMFVRMTEDSFTGKPKQSYGVRTDKLTRPLMISTLVKTAREDVNLINDRATLDEMLTFVRNEKGRPEAQDGAHDDCIMALGIAHYIRPQQAYTAEDEKPERVEWRKDQWDDYRRASKEEKAYLKMKWGEPL